MKKNTLIFIVTSTFLGLALIFSLSKAELKSQNLDDIGDTSKIEIKDLEQ
jgi:hypothetical protein